MAEKNLNDALELVRRGVNMKDAAVLAGCAYSTLCVARRIAKIPNPDGDRRGRTPSSATLQLGAIEKGAMLYFPDKTVTEMRSLARSLEHRFRMFTGTADGKRTDGTTVVRVA